MYAILFYRLTQLQPRSWRTVRQTLWRFSFPLFLSLGALPASAANSVAVQSGLGWLQNQVQANGSLAAEATSIATPLQARSEALYTLKMLATPPAAFAPLQTALAADADTSTEYLARRAWALAYSGVPQSALIDLLQQRQSGAGGYGGDSTYAAHALDTAFVLMAQKTNSAFDPNAVAQAIAYLDASKAVDGSFGVNGSPNLYVTANSMLAAAAWSGQLSTATITSSAQQWLLAQRNGAKAYGNSFDNAFALLALTGQTSQVAILQPLVDALTASQLPNGSWDNDPYLTAVALRALFSVTQAPPEPTTAGIHGIVIDAANSQVLAGVAVQVLASSDAGTSSNASGSFALTSVTPGAVALRFSKLGYASKDIALTVVAGQNVNVGNVALVAAPLTAALSGIVTNQSGTALSGVTVSTGTASAQTDNTGAYQIAGLSPGAATITASFANYQSAGANVAFVAGINYTFSPKLVANGNTLPTTTSLNGVVIDAVSKTPLVGATVSLGGASQTTGVGGTFAFSPIDAGAFVLTVSASNYQTASASGIAALGINNVGKIALAKLPASSSLSGTVTDAISGAPIAGASVQVQGQGAPVNSGVDGKYSIANLSGTSFTLSVSATGYMAQSQLVSLSQVGTAVADIALFTESAVTSDISFIKVATSDSDYSPSGVIPLEMLLANSAAANASVQVSALVFNAQGNIVYEYLASPVIGWEGKTFGNNPVTIAANSTLELNLDWNTLRLPAGTYSIKARAIDGSGRAVAEADAGFAVTAAAMLGGGVTADPPLAQAGANTPIALTADLTNNGNQTLAPGDLQLRITLDTPDASASSQAQIVVRNIASGVPMKSATKLIVDAEGNLYSVNGSDGKVVKISSAGVQSVIASLPVAAYSDLALDLNGHLWIATKSLGKVYTVTPQGAVSNIAVNTLSAISALDFTASGTLVLTGTFTGTESGKAINGETRLVQRDSAGIETVLWRNGLSTPVAMVKDDAGNYVVTNSGDGTLVKVSVADGLIVPFATGLNHPQGITRDAAGNFYVANAGDNNIIKVLANGQTSVYATGFNQPYDLKFDNAGNLYVSNAGDDAILKVIPDGTVQGFAKGIANGPQGMKYDAAGNLWISNDDGTLRKKDALDNVSVIVSGLSTPRGFAFTGNGDVLLAEYSSGKISRISNGVKSVFASGLNTPFGVAVDAAGDVFVTEKNADRIAHFDANGNKLGVIESLLNSPTVMRAGSNGDIYIQNSGFLALRNSAGEVQIDKRPFSHTYWAPDPVNGGFVVLSSYNVLRISAAGVVTTVKANLLFYPYGVVVDSAGNIIVRDYSNKKLQKIDSAGVLTELVTLPDYPSDVQSDAAGNVAVRLNNGAFYKVSPVGVISQINHSISEHIYGWSASGVGQIVAWGYTKTYRIDMATGTTTIWLASKGYNSGAAVDSAGNLLVTDSGSNNLSVYSNAGALLSQTDGFVTLGDIVWTGSELRFVDGGNRLYGITGASYPIKKSGTLPTQYLAQSGNDTLGATSNVVLKWTGLTGSGYTTYANVSGNLTGIAAHSDGSVAVAISTTSRVVVLDASKVIVKDFAGLRSPQGLAFDSANRLYVANSLGGTIARFDSLATSVASTFAQSSNPQNLAFDADGKLLVTRSGGVDRIATTGIATLITSDGGFKGIISDGTAVLVVDQSKGQLRKLNTVGNTSSWDVFAAGFATPVALRAADNGDLYVLNQGNNTLLKYSTGKLDTIATVPAGMNAMDVTSGAEFTVAGNGGIASRVALDGTVTDLKISPLVNQWALTGTAASANGKLYFLANNPADQAGSVFEIAITQPVTPPVAGTVVKQSTVAMNSMAATDAYTHFDFGTWLAPYGGDFKVEVWRDGVAGKSVNFIHVGSNADSLLTAAKAEIPPGNSQLNMCLDLKGADFTSISRVEMGQVRPVSQSGVPSGMAGDRAGNLYVTDTTTLYRTNSSGQSTVIANGMSLAFGLATDSQQNFYVASKNPSTSRYQLIRIDLLGTKTVVADLGVTTANGVAVNSRDEILVGSPGKLLKVDKQGVVTTVTTSGLPSPRGIAIDGRDNIYVQNESDFVSMIKPDGSSVNVFSGGNGVDSPTFEGDGYPNIAADCADNFYIAPYQWAKIGQSGEEHSLAQVVPRTGKTALLFDTQNIDPTLGDVDYLAFDRFSNRILMWNDNDRRIWQVPVTCGAIGVQAHLMAKPGQTFSGSSKPPSAIVPHADGRTEYVWSLRDVTAQGSQVCFDASQAGVTLGEERKAIDAGFISFQNSFATGDVTVPLAIPTVRAANLVALAVATDKADYPANDTAQVATVLNNAHTEQVTGTLKVQVFDSHNVLVGSVTQQGVTIAAAGSVPVNAPFGIGTIVPAQYTVKAVLLGNDGDLARAQASFNVLPSNVDASAKSTVATDRTNYNASDRVLIRSRATNQSDNIVLENLTLMVKVYNAAGTLQFSYGHPVPQLLPGASRDYSAPQALRNLPAGIYTVTQILSDSSGHIIDQPETSYEVQSGSANGFGLTGTISATPHLVRAGAMASFAASATNQGNASLNDLPLKISIVDPATQTVMAEYPYTQTLNAAARDSKTTQWRTTGSAGTTYVAVLSALVNGNTLTLAQDSFALVAQVAPVANGDHYSTSVNQSITIGALNGLLANDSDDDNDPLTAQVMSQPAHGQVSLNPNGSFTYVPAPGYSGSDSFNYAASDGQMTGNATVTIVIAGASVVHDIPTLSEMMLGLLSLLVLACGMGRYHFSRRHRALQHS
ncbi:MAG: carboxypeptidase regulatory-like domain-containing protein [Pseudomonadota bacterium]